MYCTICGQKFIEVETGRYNSSNGYPEKVEQCPNPCHPQCKVTEVKTKGLLGFVSFFCNAYRTYKCYGCGKEYCNGDYKGNETGGYI